MKKRKLSCFLALAMCLTVPLAACDKKDKDANVLDKHFYWENARTAYSQVTRYNGKIDIYEPATGSSYDIEHNLAAIRSTENGSKGNVVEKVEVVDLVTGDVLGEYEVENPANVDPDQKKTLEVTIDYPVIKVHKSNPSTSSSNPEREHNWSYYYAKKSNYSGSNSIESWQKEDTLKVIQHYGLYEIRVAKKVYWVNEELETLREFTKVQAGDYDTTEKKETVFNGCYDDYLYSWSFISDNRVIQVYNREGVCSMQYTLPSDVVIYATQSWDGDTEILYGEPVILNNGNILIQEYVQAEDDAADHTYVLPETGDKVYINSKIINYKTGEVKEVELDYIVEDLEAAYVSKEQADESVFPFVVREKAQNQAYISKLVNKQAKTVDYVTLDNNGKITYTVANEYVRGQGGDWDSIDKINENQYVAEIFAKGKSQSWIFNSKGKKVMSLPETYTKGNKDCKITEDYIVTEYGIYNYDKKCLYDFETSPFYTTDMFEDVKRAYMGDRICISAQNKITCEYEWYEFDGKDFVKAVGTFAYQAADAEELPKGNTATVDVVVGNDFDLKGVESYVWTLYKEDGTPLLKKQVAKADRDAKVLTMCEGAAFVQMEVDGEPIVYVVK